MYNIFTKPTQGNLKHTFNTFATHVQCTGDRSSLTKPTHTWVKSPHVWSRHPIYEIKKDYSEGDLAYFAPIVGQSI